MTRFDIFFAALGVALILCLTQGCHPSVSEVSAKTTANTTTQLDAGVGEAEVRVGSETEVAAPAPSPSRFAVWGHTEEGLPRTVIVEQGSSALLLTTRSHSMRTVLSLSIAKKSLNYL